MLQALTLFLVLIPIAVAADLTGSSIHFLGPYSADTGTTETFQFLVANGSSDGAVIDELHFAFHPCATVLGGGYDDSGASNDWLYSLEVGPSHYATWWHPTDDIGSHMEPGDGGLFWLDVALGVDCPCGQLPIEWTLLGLGGGESNVLSGGFSFAVDCPTPAAGSDWSEIKRLH